MRRSIRRIRNENELYYNDTYLKKISRKNKLRILCFFVIWVFELGFLKYSCDSLYFYRQAGKVSLADKEVKEWVGQQVVENYFDAQFAVIVLMVLVMAGFIIGFWYVKSYNLYKYKKLILYFPLVFVLSCNLVILVLVRYQGKFYSMENKLLFLGNVIPYLTMVRLLFPFEIKGLEKGFWQYVDVAGRILRNL